MTDRPINLLEPDLRRLAAGARRIWRPSVSRVRGQLGHCLPGDRLWIREPFHLHAVFDDISPLQAVGRQAQLPYWPADGDQPADWVGRRRFARELPRVLHRRHLVYRSQRFVRLQTLAQEDLAGEGFADEAAVRRWWTVGGSGRGIDSRPVPWAENPWLLELTVDLVPAPAEIQMPADGREQPALETVA